MPLVGRILGNRYEIIEQLGGGGMALVFKGRDLLLNRLVTIKILRPELAEDEEFAARFRREAQAVASLSHPNIVSIYDVGREGNIHYLVMEYVDGQDLKTLIKKQGRLPADKALSVAINVCAALSHAHENNIVHRDVKPHNILITRDGRVKLTDFGIARQAAGGTITYVGERVWGSVHYFSPEQARGEQGGPASDIYSLGVVLYEMLTGRQPFSGESAVAVALKHLQETPERPSLLVPGLSRKVEEIVMRALQKDPRQRFGSAREMKAVLTEALAELKPAEREVAEEVDSDLGDEETTQLLAVVQPRKKRRLKPAARWVLFLIALLLLSGGGYLVLRWYTGVPVVRVPSVVGMSVDDATRVLQEQGLNVKVREVYHMTVPAGRVIEQDVGPDSPPVKRGRTVTLTVSLGPDLRLVPDLYNITLVEARVRLAEAGLELGEVQYAFNDTVAKDYICGQDPKPRLRVPRGSKVTVVVSQGPKPQTQTMPNLMGLTLEQARSRLAELQLTVDEASISWSNSTDYLRGQVIAQEPLPGTMVNAGTAVKLVLSNGPGPAPKEVRVIIPVPSDGKSHKVKITLQDVRGVVDEYTNTHSSGEQVVKDVRYYGRATIRIYIDDRLVKEESVS